MGKKTIHLISFVLALALAGVVSAATIQWDNGGEGPLWTVPENWDSDSVPTIDDDIRIDVPDANCLIDASVKAEGQILHVGYEEGFCYLDMTGGTLTLGGTLSIGRQRGSNGVFTMNGGTVTSTGGRLWLGYSGSGTLIMNDGVMNIYDKIEIGKNADANGVLYMNGGTINFAGESSGTDLEIATYGKGAIYMTGGVINVEDYIKLAQGNSSTKTGVARLYLYGGTLNAKHLRDASQIYGDPKIDLSEGALVLTGDNVSTVTDYINRGWIVAYDSNGIVDVTYTTDPNQTTVTGRRLDPELAWGPTPRQRATVPPPVTLTWQPGVYTVSHDVYFGTDFNDVNEASRDDPRDVLVSQGQAETTLDPGPLALGQTCYWRVDEVNDANAASPWKGVVWQFTVTDYLVVDDFESYNALADTEEGSRPVYYTWVDGYDDPSANGGVIGYTEGDPMETKTVHGGKQSVAVTYDDSTAPYSEVTVNPADLPVGSDWSRDGLSTLSLWFYGGALNAPDQMYVKLNGVKVLYGGPAADLLKLEWQQWNIPLADFSIDLSDVTELTIGFTKAGAFGGYGMVFFDDIRLLTAPPEP